MGEVAVWAEFRTHVLLPHEAVGAIKDTHPTYWLQADGPDHERVYSHEGTEAFQVVKHVGPKRTQVTVKALREIWVQEPGVTISIAGDGTWVGIGRKGEVTGGPYPLRDKDAHVKTVHFHRAVTHPAYTCHVEYREGRKRWRLFTDGGFELLLKQRPPTPVPWQECRVFDEDYFLSGVYRNDEKIRRWELAGLKPDIGQMHFLGWTGGPGVCVNARGGTPPDEPERYNLLWQPRSWRRMKAGQSLSQMVRMEAP